MRSALRHRQHSSPKMVEVNTGSCRGGSRGSPRGGFGLSGGSCVGYIVYFSILVAVAVIGEFLKHPARRFVGLLSSLHWNVSESSMRLLNLLISGPNCDFRIIFCLNSSTRCSRIRIRRHCEGCAQDEGPLGGGIRFAEQGKDGS